MVVTDANTPASALLALGQQASGQAELRPALLKEYSTKTLRCYRQRFDRYQEWCTQAGYQPAADAITTEKIIEYVEYQVKLFLEWREGGLAPEDRPGDLLVPDTLLQAVNALMYYAQRSADRIPDDREAKEIIRGYKNAWNAEKIPRAYTVVGRRTPRRGRRSTAVDGTT